MNYTEKAGILIPSSLKLAAPRPEYGRNEC
jgi:hypothetical protein